MLLIPAGGFFLSWAINLQFLASLTYSGAKTQRNAVLRLNGHESGIGCGISGVLSSDPRSQLRSKGSHFPKGNAGVSATRWTPMQRQHGRIE